MTFAQRPLWGYMLLIRINTYERKEGGGRFWQREILKCHVLAHLCLSQRPSYKSIFLLKLCSSKSKTINTLLSESLNEYLININYVLSTLSKTEWEGEASALPSWSPHVWSDRRVCE